MSIIYSTISNEKYTVSCMGKMVYVYEKAGRELGRFSFDGAEFALISADGDTFAVKAKNGAIAFFSLSQLKQTALLNQGSGASCEAETGMAFSADGKKLYDVEGDAIAVYDVCGKCEKLSFDNLSFSQIECGDEVFVLGKENEKGFVAKLADEKIADKKYITDEEYALYFNYKCAENKGFTSAAVEHYMSGVSDAEKYKTSLCELWSK